MQGWQYPTLHNRSASPCMRKLLPWYFLLKVPIPQHTPHVNLEGDDKYGKIYDSLSGNQRLSNGMVQSKEPFYLLVIPHSKSDWWCHPPHSLILIWNSDLVIKKPHGDLAYNKCSFIHCIKKLNAFLLARHSDNSQRSVYQPWHPTAQHVYLHIQ